MTRALYLPLLLAVALVGCDAAAPSSTTDAAGAATAMAGVIHHVSAGGNDVCEAVGQAPGCDGNYSLTARMKADGSVKGQYQDTFNGGGKGLHGDIDCLNVVGNGAVVGGTIIRGENTAGDDLAGLPYLAAVRDNGTSRKDPADQISASVFRLNSSLPTCDILTPDNFRLFDLTRGQVRVD